MVSARLLAACALFAPLATPCLAAPIEDARASAAPAAGEVDGPGLALRARKALAVPLDGEQVIDNAVLLVKDGKITAIGPARTTPIPAGYEVVDLGDQWIMPGLVDLHSHVGGLFDINEAVYLANPGLRVTPSVVPHNDMLKPAVAAGVTTILFIPGSATNLGGQGVLMKTGLDRYEDAVLRFPGSLKLAQAGNPEGWTVGVGRSFMNWNTRNVFRRGLAYAERWKAHAEGRGPRPERDLEFDVFPALLAKSVQISTHTQIYQVVMTTLTMIRKEFGLDVFIDHGEMAGYRLAGYAQELGVPAILGPRAIEIPTRQFIQWTGSNPEAILGIAAMYQKNGHKQIGFNTDAPVVPEEELSLQAGMGVRYGLDNTNLESIRGLTIVPALTADIEARVGSLEVGKDADVVALTGDVGDPRTSVERVWINGKKVYDTATEVRRW
jgi:imidazolonepropionase-like amidohydrolase